jgi:dimethylhistidine N-methyltransferase
MDPGSGWSRHDGEGYTIHAQRPAYAVLAFAESVARGLEDHPRWLSCTYLYDKRGSEIFEKITEQPEYYQTRTENGILERTAGDLRQEVGDATVIELGSGSSTKTRHILSAWTAHGPSRYVPLDVSQAALEGACQDLAARFPSLAVEGLAATYEQGLPVATQLSPLMLVFLGSTIGNFKPAELDTFLDMISGRLQSGDHFLLGIDLVKKIDRLERAYNDAAGWTDRFTLNLFERMNRDLGCRIPADAVEHVSYYNDRLDRIEIFARFKREVLLEIPSLKRSFRLAAGEMVLTEISRKFRVSDVAANMNRYGLSLVRAETDPDDLFAVLLFRRRQRAPVPDSRKRVVETLLRRVRSRTLELVAPLIGRGTGEVSPSLAAECAGHVDSIASFEKTWLVDALKAPSDEPSARTHTRSSEPPSAAASDRSDSISQEPGRVGAIDHLEDPPRSARSSPPAILDDALANLAVLHREALACLAAAELDPTRRLGMGGRIHLQMGSHEAACQELILQAIQEHGDPSFEPLEPDAAPPRPDHSPAGDMVLVPAGAFVIGASPGSGTPDHDQPSHRVDLAAFYLDATAVTNGQFLAFMADGGYERPDLWSRSGWTWRQAHGITAPGQWYRDADGWTVRLFDEPLAIDPKRPVNHVSWYEADAFAGWAGKRLPTEQEWEKAAACDPETNSVRPYPWGVIPATHDHANLDQRLGQPTPVGSYPRGRSFYGCHQMLGDVWEWTASPMAPYPGFEPFPEERHSAALFAGGRMVLRGGSWATLAVAVRNNSRRGAPPGDRSLFAGFRCARDT